MSLQNIPSPNTTTDFPVPPGPANHLEADRFVDRRNSKGVVSTQAERRQFGSSHNGLSENGRELAFAIDQYKLENHRRYLTCDEMLIVLSDLGYRKVAN